MNLSHDIMVRMHAGELTPAAAFDLQALRDAAPGGAGRALAAAAQSMRRRQELDSPEPGLLTPPCRAHGYPEAAAWIQAAGSPELQALLAMHVETVEPRRPAAEGGNGSLSPCIVARRRREIVEHARAAGWTEVPVGEESGEMQQQPAESADTPTPAAASPAGTVDLVVPLGTGSKHDDLELRLLLRSARAHLRGLRLIHVIGPRQPAWLVTHPGVRFHPWKQVRQKNHDIIRKFLAAAAMPEVSESFVAACDDWVFLQDSTPGGDFGAVQNGTLSNEIRQRYWKRCQASTRMVLAQAGKPVAFYDTHTPSVQTKAGWLRVAREVHWQAQTDHAVWSLYHNVAGVHGPVLGAAAHCGWHSGDGLAKPKSLAEIELATAGRRFLKYNDGGLNTHLQQWLAARFPDPAPWESKPAGPGAAAAIRVSAPVPGSKPLEPPRARPAANLGKVEMTTPPGVFAASVTVTCHAPYLASLRACLTSVDRQTLLPVSRLLCLDSVPEVPAWIAAEFPHWRVERGQWRSPNPQRNLGWQTQPAPWTWYMDADNVAHPEYLAGAATRAADHVGIVHADLAYTNGRKLPAPEGLDYWGMRLRNYVDTAAVWRRDAIRESGGWRLTERWDDWDLALRVTAAGWHTARNPVPILFTVHPKGEEHRNAHGVDLAHKWGRSYGIVSLLAGRKGCWDTWRAAFLAHEFPERCTVYLVDDSHSAEFAAEIGQFRARLEGERGLQVQVLRPAILPEEGTAHWDRHRRVCRLYNAVMPRVAEDVVWTWEDDKVPRTPHAGRDLCAHWQHTCVGGICAMYETRSHPGLICGSPGKDHWGPLKSLASCRGRRQDGWGFIPGGFAMFHTPLVLAAMPFCVSFPNGKGDSWDGKLSRTVRAAGFRLDLDGSVEVDHLFREG